MQLIEGHWKTQSSILSSQAREVEIKWMYGFLFIINLMKMAKPLDFKVTQGIGWWIVDEEALRLQRDPQINGILRQLNG